jgi:hypothetical protein
MVRSLVRTLNSTLYAVGGFLWIQQAGKDGFGAARILDTVAATVASSSLRASARLTH